MRQGGMLLESAIDPARRINLNSRWEPARQPESLARYEGGRAIDTFVPGIEARCQWLG
jgi:hypothetical protein